MNQKIQTSLFSTCMNILEVFMKKSSIYLTNGI